MDEEGTSVVDETFHSFQSALDYAKEKIMKSNHYNEVCDEDGNVLSFIGKFILEKSSP